MGDYDEWNLDLWAQTSLTNLWKNHCCTAWFLSSFHSLLRSRKDSILQELQGNGMSSTPLSWSSLGPESRFCSGFHSKQLKTTTTYTFDIYTHWFLASIFVYFFLETCQNSHHLCGIARAEWNSGTKKQLTTINSLPQLLRNTKIPGCEFKSLAARLKWGYL